ncbi:sodium/glucose cotransporter 4-like [Glandiceps talaboti]
MATTCRPNRGTSAGYFLAGRDMMWFLVGSSLFASNIGSYHFIGLAGSGAAAGWGAGAYEFNALYFLVMLGWLMLPVYIAGGVYTMPEYLKKRFGRQRLRIYYSILSLLLYIFTKISVDLYSGAVFIQETLKWNVAASILFLLILTAIYTVLGGLAAVIWTDTANFVVMMVGGVILMIIAFVEIGGMKGILEDYPCSVPNATLYDNNTCGIPREDSFRMFRHPIGSDMPFPGFVLGQSPASIWYWCTDQVIVQRALAAKNLSHAKGGTLLAGYFKILPTFMMVIPGMIARILWPDEIACVSEEVCLKVCNSPVGCTNIAYPRMVMELLPVGLRGLMIAVMLAALMSSLTSIFNSGATIFVVDIWKVYRKKCSEKESMIVGRIFVLILVFISVLWLPVVSNSQGGQLWHYIQEVTGYLSPPISAVFILAMFWSGVNEPGVFYSLMISLFFGCMRFLFMIIFPSPPCGEEDTRSLFIRMHYFYVATLLFWGTMLFCWIISKCTKQRIPMNMQYRLTYWTRHSKEERIDIDDIYKDTTTRDDDVIGDASHTTYDNAAYEKGEFERNDESGDITDTKESYSNGPTSTWENKDNLEEKANNSNDTKANEEKCDDSSSDCGEGNIPPPEGATAFQGVCRVCGSDLEVQCDLPEDFDIENVEGVTKYGSVVRVATRNRKKTTSRAWDVTWKYCCGVSSDPEVKLTEAEMKALEVKITSIEQTKAEKIILNINLIIIMTVGAILYAFFGFIIDRVWKANGEIDCPQYYQ